MSLDVLFMAFYRPTDVLIVQDVQVEMKPSSGRHVIGLRRLVILWAALLIAAVSANVSGTQRIGTVAWGPTDDIRSIAIAISDLKFGLKGGLGYRVVMQAVTDVMTAQKSDIAVGDDLTRQMVADPAIVTKAIQAGAAVTREQLSDVVVHEVAEEVGYATFYKVAFQFFGYNSYSTYYLYLVLWWISATIFVVTYRHRAAPIAFFAISASCFYLLTNIPSLFSVGMPSLSAGRCLWTLALMPLAHLLFAQAELSRLGKGALIATIVQSLIAAFGISARYTGQWCIFAVLLTGFSLSILYRKDLLLGLKRLKDSMLTGEPNSERRSNFTGRLGAAAESVSLLPRAFTVTLIVLVTVIGYQSIEKLRFDRSYFTDDYLPHHLVWHSGYLGLTLNPDWVNLKPYPELPDYLSDAVAFTTFENIMKSRGLPYVSPEGLHKLRLHDQIIRGVFLDFAMRHPGYMATLYATYKLPNVIGTFYNAVLFAMRGYGFFIFLITTLLSALLLLSERRRYAAGASLVAIPSIVGCSMLPGLWAYAVIDQGWTGIFLAQFGAAFILFLYVRYAQRFLHDNEPARISGSHGA